MAARLQAVVLSLLLLLVVVPAVLLVPAGPARGQSPPPACPRESVGWLAGVGFIDRERYVAGVAIFAPGTTLDLEKMWIY